MRQVELDSESPGVIDRFLSLFASVQPGEGLTALLLMLNVVTLLTALVAQFWAFANDIYTQKKGERLFGVVGIGASLGAILGPWLAGLLFVWLGIALAIARHIKEGPSVRIAA